MHITSKVCMKKDVGLNGNLFGGNMLAWMDEVSYIFANDVTSGKYILVTKRFGEIVFKRPVVEGDIVHFVFGNVNIGTTSISFDVSANVDGETVFTTSATFVALDKDGNKVKINKDWIKNV